uniref:Uncharacterized protein n=1 Tax=Arion vulgaris TaxID=1028688 RepID=A0A0B7BL53_9EUPU
MDMLALMMSRENVTTMKMVMAFYVQLIGAFQEVDDDTPSIRVHRTDTLILTNLADTVVVPDQVTCTQS